MKNPVDEFPSGIHPRVNFMGIEIPVGKNSAEYGPVGEFPVGKYFALKYPMGECSDGKSPPARQYKSCFVAVQDSTSSTRRSRRSAEDPGARSAPSPEEKKNVLQLSMCHQQCYSKMT